MPDRAAPITVVVLTFNEERNLDALLESVAGWAAAVFVVDSWSTDSTAAMAERSGARVVFHPFDTHARQWQWALSTLPIETEWVLALDADQRLTPELREQITAALGASAAGGPDGYFIARRQVFRGRWIRHGGYYPKYLLKLFKRSRVSLDERELVDHHFHVAGRVATLRGDLIEDNRNEAAIAAWIAKHNRYATLQAKYERDAGRCAPRVGFTALFRSPDARTQWLKQLWSRLPLFVRPVLYFGYRYFLRLGFLDGKEGFVFHVMQAFWYRLLVDVNLDELNALAPRPTGRTTPVPATPVAPAFDAPAESPSAHE